ncbi:MAG: DGQHR domain-containing protein [Bacteroidetes bacterium]|nr:DGQHR domain-containing protein [Bacteroidota bacterium]
MISIIGKLCINEKELKRTASKRRKECIEESVQHDQVAIYEKEGWEVVRKNKMTTRMKKKKALNVLFEDRVWMVFYNLGFSYMNKDQNCKLEFDIFSKQIDVLARDEDNIFVVECRSSRSEEIINAKDVLEEYVGKQREIERAIKKEWGQRCGRINTVVLISSQDKRDKDEAYVKEKRKEGKNIFLWSEREIKYIENLIRQVGSTAKYQLYSVIFANKKQKKLKVACPAIKGQIGSHTFYTFLISAKQLLKYAYVHHRHLTGIVEASQVYQRMLRNNKLKQIKKFIDYESGYFPNSIIVNFSKPLQWSRKEAFDDNIAMGTLTLPEYFGSAWIIDGQHRLYGVAKANEDVLVPVLAFENMEELEQANLFVEINVKQTSVDKKLLWDLYSDIYRDSSDEKQKLKYQIAETSKKMEASGPLKDCIDIPSIPVDRDVKLSLTTVCDTIEKYMPWDHLKHPSNKDKTPENVARIINSYFEVLKLLWPEDWAKGNKGVLLTNNAFGVFMMVFQDIINHIAYKNKLLLQEHKASEFKKLLKEIYLTPLIEYLKTDEKLQKEIKKQTGRGPQSYNAGVLDLKIQEFVKDYSPTRTGGVPTIPQPEQPPAIPSIEEKAKDAEYHLRNFVIEKLKSNYGSDKWWKQGIPGGLKRKADDRWLKEVTRKPYLQSEKKANERKFGFFDLGDMLGIIIYGQNWGQIFQPVFIGKNDFQRRIKDIKALRDPVSHIRKIDDLDVADGSCGLLWLSNTLGIKELNPYA